MYERNHKTWTKHIDFMILDAICLELSFLFAYILRFNILSVKELFADITWVAPYQRSFVYILLLHGLVVFMAAPYTSVLKRNVWKECRKVVLYNIYMLIGLVFIMFIEKSSVLYSRIVIFLFPFVSSAMMLGMRECYKYILRKRINREAKQDCVLLVAPSDRVEKIVEQFYKERISTLKIVGIVLSDEGIQSSDQWLSEIAATVEVERKLSGDYIKGIPVVGTRADMFEYARTNIVDEVMLYVSGEDTEEITKTFISMGITVHICLDSLIQMAKSSMNEVNGIPVVTTYTNIVSSRQMFIKRLIDIAFGLAGSLITVILTIFVAPMIWIADPGPIFFRQERVGKNGRTFKIWKFRTMCVNADAMKADLMDQNENETDGMFKMAKDPRIIGINKKFSVGSFLRKTSIDEFPQFFNILAGSMSLVGTRPPTMDEYEKYQLHHKGRLAIKPGLTGMWQTYGRGKVTDFEKVVKMDKYYIDHFSIWFDFKLILKTIEVVLKQEGAQ